MGKKLIIVSSITILLSGCGLFSQSEKEEVIPVTAATALKATAKVMNAEGSEVGNVTFTEEDEGVLISLNLRDIPEGEHGIHIHEVSKCEKPKFESAGSHFNPLHKQHGIKNPKGPHLGDLPNIVPDENGVVEVEFTAKNITLEKGMENSLFDKDGSSIVIHETADDYVTDPAGNSGARIACGEIISVNNN